MEPCLHLHLSKVDVSCSGQEAVTLLGILSRGCRPQMQGPHVTCRAVQENIFAIRDDDTDGFAVVGALSVAPCLCIGETTVSGFLWVTSKMVTLPQLIQPSALSCWNSVCAAFETGNHTDHGGSVHCTSVVGVIYKDVSNISPDYKPRQMPPSSTSHSHRLSLSVFQQNSSRVASTCCL